MGRLPFTMQLLYRKDDIVLFLLAQGAHVDARDKDGMTSMHYAAKTRNRDLMNSLFEKGADVNTQDNDGKTPMHWAAASGSESCIEFLVNTGRSTASMLEIKTRRLLCTMQLRLQYSSFAQYRLARLARYSAI